MPDNTNQQYAHTNDRAFIMAMESMTKRLEKTESNFGGALQRVEDRLDQLVDLTKTVAVLQQQNAQHNDTITELRTQLRDSTEKFQTSLSRLHTRMDEIQNHQRDRMELLAKEMAIDVKSNELAIHAVDKELKTWLNRGWGAWFIVALVMATANTMFFRWVDSIDKDKTQIVQTVEKLTKDELILEQRMQVQESASKDSGLTLKQMTDHPVYRSTKGGR